MLRFITFLLLIFCGSLTYGQNITLTGTINDPDGLPLESATVYLTSVQDSTVVNYTITDSKGKWIIKTRAIEKPVFLKVSFVGFSNYRQRLESITEDKDYGTIKLQDNATELSEVVVEGEAPPIRIKKDTLEFNASSFKVRPDSNVQTLLKQLPGVEVDQDGTIRVNGKEVNQILVNGKPFFDKDGKIALQNLPAEIINKVQVTDTKTKKEELTGQRSSGNNSSINLTIDEDKNKGVFGKVMGGYGTNDRYESSLLFNYFKGERKLSVLAASNNINSSGFSMNEIFDSMGGGRNSSIWTNSNGSFGINGIQFGASGSGITTSNMLGINYSDELIKDFDQNASYFYTSADTKNNNRSVRTNFLTEPLNGQTIDGITDYSYKTTSESKSDNLQFAHNFSTQFDFKIDSLTRIYIQPKYTRANNKSTNYSSSSSALLEDGRLLNDYNGFTLSENDNSGFNNQLVFNKAFKKKGRSIDVTFDNNNQTDEGYNLNQSFFNTYNYEDGTQQVSSDNRNQVLRTRQADDSYDVGLEYMEPITDSLRAKFEVAYEIQKNVSDRKGYDYNDTSGDFSTYNDSLSYYLSRDIKTLRPTAGFNLNKSKIWANIEGGVQFADLSAASNYVDTKFNLNKNYVFPYVQSGISYRMERGKSLWLGYSYNVDYQQLRQFLPVYDISSQQHYYVGNPDLDPQKYHNVNLSYRNYDFSTRSGYSIYAGGNYNTTDITNYSTVDRSAKTTTTYQNINDTYYWWFGGNWSKQIKKDEHTFRISLGARGNYNVSKGYLNTELYDSKTLSITPRLNFTYEYGELLTINPSYNFTYNQTNYTNYRIKEATNSVHQLSLQTTSYWPKHLVFGNDFTYTYNTQLVGFQKSFFLWNTSLGYNFLDDQLLFKVKVYDLLNQNIGTQRTIDATSITDQQNTVLKRYVMFSLTYSLKKFGGKEPGKGRGFRMWD